MAKFDISITIKRPVEDVFAVFSNVEKRPQVAIGHARGQADLARPHRRGHNDALRQYDPRPTHRIRI